VNQHSGIPRPRTYDVLNGLIGKGLLMEQPGRPTMYAVVPPQVGLSKMLEEYEGRAHRQLEDKKRAFRELEATLMQLQSKTQQACCDEEMVWVTRRDSAFLARYCEAISNVESEFTVITPVKTMPEKELVQAVKHALQKGKTVRVLREITPTWTREDIDVYLDLIKMGEQVRHLKYDGLRFATFDRKESLVVMPKQQGYETAVWVQLPALAEILCERFDKLWQQGEPARDVLMRLREKKS
jgi:sugar-specific transcriptional regulator TrmB